MNTHRYYLNQVIGFKLLQSVLNNEKKRVMTIALLSGLAHEGIGTDKAHCLNVIIAIVA